MRFMLALGFVIALSLTSTPTANAQGASVIWVNEPKPGQLPDGVTHRTFTSKANKTDVGYCVYLIR
jgi:hypothetical protein